MNDSNEQQLKTWIDTLLAATVRELGENQVVAGALLEAKPAWIFPFRILIGKIREQGDETAFYWFISGGLPTAVADSSVAATPREAARYFALRWQLSAARGEDRAEELAADAEALYRIVDQDDLWQD